MAVEVRHSLPALDSSLQYVRILSLSVLMYRLVA